MTSTQRLNVRSEGENQSEGTARAVLCVSVCGYQENHKEGRIAGVDST